MRGPCARLSVQCMIQTNDYRTMWGSNICNNAQFLCPRAPGEDYKKCKTVCDQPGHAETEALRQAIEAYGADVLRGGVAHVWGHYTCCRECSEALARAGIKEIIIHVNEDALP